MLRKAAKHQITIVVCAVVYTYFIVQNGRGSDTRLTA